MAVATKPPDYSDRINQLEIALVDYLSPILLDKNVRVVRGSQAEMQQATLNAKAIVKYAGSDIQQLTFNNSVRYPNIAIMLQIKSGSQPSPTANVVSTIIDSLETFQDSRFSILSATDEILRPNDSGVLVHVVNIRVEFINA